MQARNASQHDKEAFAARMESALVARIGAARFQMWFGGGNVLFVPANREVVVAVAGTQFIDWLEPTFGEAILAAACDVVGAESKVRYVCDPELFQTSARSSDVVDTKPSHSHRASAPEPEAAKPEKATRPKAVIPRRWRQLNDFIVGSCNRVAHAAAVSVVDDPSDCSNPLVFHGPVGTGKTHLLEGIYAALKRKYPDSRPLYITAEEFTTRFVQASRFEKSGAFRRQFRECSALLLDDLHFLASKPGTQKEFVHTLDALLADGRPVVMTTDCHPRLAEELMPELIDRLFGGAVWPLQPPDDETRLAILRNKSAGTPPISDHVLKYLAKNLRGNVRELEGAINSIRHYARHTGLPIDPVLVRDALGDLLRHNVRNITLKEIDEAVCVVLRLASGSLQSKARSWAVSHPRMIAMYLCRKHTAATYGEIAKHFGVKNHSTAVAAEKNTRNWMKDDTKLPIGERTWMVKDLLDRIERELHR